MPVLNIQIEDRDWPLDLGSMLLSEAEECETLTGWTTPQWVDALLDSRARAIKFAYYLARRRAGEPLDYASIDLNLNDITWGDGGDDDDGEVEAPPELGVTGDGEGPTGPEEAAPPTLDV